jgi:uncharacterized protein
MSEKKAKWWQDGVQFECQGSGKCCTSRGEYGFVYFSLEDRERAAKYFKISEAEFRNKYCQMVENQWALKEPANKSPDCIFLKDNRCAAYEARPTQCRTWPWWPEVMSAKSWSRAVADYCPGVGKGKFWTAEEIQQNMLAQKLNDQSLIKEASSINAAMKSRK